MLLNCNISHKFCINKILNTIKESLGKKVLPRIDSVRDNALNIAVT